jgi:predicted secreted protein
MRRSILMLGPLLAIAGAAGANTGLHLSDTETVMAHPDLLVATLQAIANAPSAAAAQQQVNAAVSAALARARQVPNVTVSTQQYTSWQPKEHGSWQASQAIRLSSHDGAALLALAGQLQASGLAATELGWELSPEATRNARNQAMREAIANLHSRADEAAGLLGLRFLSFDKVNIATPPPFPGPRMVGLAMAAAAPAPPSAVAEDVPVSATVQADATLVSQ